MVVAFLPNTPSPNTAPSSAPSASNQTVQPVATAAAVPITAQSIKASQGSTSGKKGDALRKRDARKDGARKHAPDDHKKENLHLNLVI